MSSRPWYKWFPGDYLGATLDLKLEEDALYRRILDAAWMRGPLPGNVAELSRILRVHPNKMRATWGGVSPYICGGICPEVCGGVCRGICGGITHERIERQRAELAEKSKKAKAAGRKGGLANAKATRAGARAGTDPEPEKDLKQRPDQDLQNKPALPRSTPPPNSDARELTAEERQQAEAMQADLEARRTAAGIGDGPRPIGTVARLVAGKGGFDGKAE